MSGLPNDPPEFRPGNVAIYWFLRDHCRWPMPAKAVYEALFKRWGGKELFPSDALLAKDIGTSPATIKRWRKWLRLHGVLTWNATTTQGGANQYELLPPWQYLGDDLGQNNLGQTDRGQNNLGQTSSDLGHGDLGQNNLGHGDLGVGHSDLGDLGHGDLRSIKYKEIKRRTGGECEGRGPAGAATANLHEGETQKPTWEIDWHLYWSLLPLVSEFDRHAKAKITMSFLRGPLGDALLALAGHYAPLADQAGVPLAWWWDAAAIWLRRHPGAFDGTADAFGAVLARAANGEVLNPDLPPWFTARLWDAYTWWENDLGAPITIDALVDVCRWHRVLTAADRPAWPRSQGSHQRYAACQDLLRQLQEQGVCPADDLTGRRYQFAAIPDAFVERRLACEPELGHILSVAFTQPAEDEDRDLTDGYHDLQFRLSLINCMTAGDLTQAMALIEQDPVMILDLIDQRDWLRQYPALAPALRTATESALALADTR